MAKSQGWMDFPPVFKSSIALRRKIAFYSMKTGQSTKLLALKIKNKLVLKTFPLFFAAP